MPDRAQGSTILMVDDDEDDRFLVKAALTRSGVQHQLVCVESGEAMIDYLLRRRRFADPKSAPCPGIILLDLNMPGMDGEHCLRELRAHEDFKHIPVVILTTSAAETDVKRCYQLGANSYVVKPLLMDTMVAALERICEYWFGLVELVPCD
ncbi:MAG: response regulator [Deltaproteobacteria bacterium]|nr:response regulator [Deltaproteobacteria bacterium]